MSPSAQGCQTVAVQAPSAETYLSTCAQLVRFSIARQFLLLCAAISGRRSLRVAVAGTDSEVFFLASELGCYSELSLTVSYFGESDVSGMLQQRPIHDYLAEDFDATLVLGGSLAEEEEVWTSLAAHRRICSSHLPISSGCLRLTRAVALFREAMLSFAPGTFQSCLDSAKLMILSIALQQSLGDGIILEAGTYRGGSALFSGHHLRLLAERTTLHAFDTFAGIPRAGEKDGDTPWTSGAFVDTSVGLVQSFVEGNDLTRHVALHPGRVSETLPRFLAESAPVSFAFLDTDQYESTHTCVEAILPKLVPNGLILIDDARDPGVAQAIVELHQAHPGLRGCWPRFNMYLMYDRWNSWLNTPERKR